MSELNPITRKEMFLAAAAGQDIELPTPITRKEMFLAKIAEQANSGGGNGGDVLAWREIANTEAVSELDQQLGVFGFSVYWNTLMALEAVPETLSVTLDDTLYENLHVTTVPGFGELVGNLFFANTMLGTNFPNTDEPFLGVVFTNRLYLITLETAPTTHTVAVSTYCKPLISLPMIDLTKYFEDLTEEGQRVDAQLDDAYTKEVWEKLLQNDTVLLKLQVTGFLQTVVAHPIHFDQARVAVSTLVYTAITPGPYTLCLDARTQKLDAGFYCSYR